MLNFIYYPISAILWFWHKIFGTILGESNVIAWILSVVFLVFTIRAILFKPFVGQVRSMRKMQKFAPEVQKLKKKYGDDRQKMAAEMQKLQAEHGVNPIGGCLPMFVQIPVFIGLFHVLKSFNRDFLTAEQNRNTGNYVFGADEVRSFLDAKLFGVSLSANITQASEQLDRLGDPSRWQIAAIAVPLTILAGILTHITARHSVARQTAAQAENPQTAIMNKVMLYLFPLGVIAGGPFFPIAILIYWLSNNSWTMFQQRVVYKKIDSEEDEAKEAAVSRKQNLAPKPGQRPARKGSAAPTAAKGDVDLTKNGASDGNGAEKTDDGSKTGTNGKTTTSTGAQAGGAQSGGAKPKPKPGGSAGNRGGGNRRGGSRSGSSKRGRKRR